MTNWKRLIAVAGFLSCLGASSAQAAFLDFSLNCTFTGPVGAGTCGAPVGPFGTVRLADNTTNGNWLDFTVDMFPQGGIPNFALFLYLNWPGPNDLKFGGIEYEWAFSGANVDKLTYKVNDVGIGYQYLDIELGEKNQPDPWMGTLILRQKNNPTVFFDLDPITFAIMADDPQAGGARVWLAVEQELKTQPSSTFTMVGSIGDRTVAPVPEPGSLVLLGTGILGFGAWRLRSRKS